MAPGWIAPQGVENVHTLCAGKPESDDRGNSIVCKVLTSLMYKALYKNEILLSLRANNWTFTQGTTSSSWNGQFFYWFAYWLVFFLDQSRPIVTNLYVNHDMVIIWPLSIDRIHVIHKGIPDGPCRRERYNYSSTRVNGILNMKCQSQIIFF